MPLDRRALVSAEMVSIRSDSLHRTMWIYSRLVVFEPSWADNDVIFIEKGLRGPSDVLDRKHKSAFGHEIPKSTRACQPSSSKSVSAGELSINEFLLRLKSIK